MHDILFPSCSIKVGSKVEVHSTIQSHIYTHTNLQLGRFHVIDFLLTAPVWDSFLCRLKFVVQFKVLLKTLRAAAEYL